MAKWRATAVVTAMALIGIGTRADQDLIDTRIPTTKEATESNRDLWAEAALRQKGGPSYEFFAKLLPPLRYVDASFRVYPITLSAPSATVKARLVGDGSAVNARARQLGWAQETGIPVIFHAGDKREVFGSDPSRLSGPKFAEGYLPIVQLAYDTGSSVFEEEAFCSTDPALAGSAVVFVKFTLKSCALAPPFEPKVRPERLSEAVPGVENADNVKLINRRHDDKLEARFEGPERYTCRKDRILTGDGKLLALAYPGWITNPGRGALIAPLRVGESCYLAIFTKPADPAGLKLELTPEIYAAQREQCAATWNAILDKGVKIVTPEKVVNDAWRATSIMDFMLINGDEMRYSAGNQYDKRYIGEGGDSVRTLALYGWPEDAKRIIPTQFAYTRKGLEFHQAAFKLQMLAHCYRLTKDAAFVKQIEPLWRKELDVILEGREPATGMLPKEKYCGDVDTRVWSLNSNANCWRALREMSVILGELGNDKEARSLAEAAAGYRKVILENLEKAIRRDVDPPFVPIALSGEEDPHSPIWATTIGSYWNLMINYVLGSGVFTPQSQTASDILHYMQENGGLMMGILRARSTPGAFWVRGGRLNDLYGLRYNLTLLARDEADRALVSFYGKLAQAMTRDTFIGGEGSGIGSVDQYGRQLYLPPNSAANTNFLQTLRYMLIQDYDMDDDGQPETLRLLFATPRAWLENGKTIEVTDAPTLFGPVSVKATSDLAKNRVVATVKLPERQAPKKVLLRLRLPEGRIASASAGGQPLKLHGETMDLSALSGQVAIEATVER